MEEAQKLRKMALDQLRAALTFATAGEIARAAQFLDFAREVRSGKQRLRAGSRRRSAHNRYGYRDHSD